MTNKKCPRCKSKKFQLVDYYITGYIYEVEDGVVTGEGQDDGGDHVKTVCLCRNCGHHWHPRNLDNDFVIDN